MDSSKTVLNDLVEGNVLGIKGDKDKESFFMLVNVITSSY